MGQTLATLLLTTALLIQIATAAPRFTNTEFDCIAEGRPFLITWANSTGPVDLTLSRQDNVGNFWPHSLIVEGYRGTNDSYTWTPAPGLPTSVFKFMMRDGSGGDAVFSRAFSYPSVTDVVSDASSSAAMSTPSSSSTPSTPSSTSCTASATSTPSGSASSQQQINTSAPTASMPPATIAGIAVGVTAAATLLSLSALLCYRFGKRRERATFYSPSAAPINEDLARDLGFIGDVKVPAPSTHTVPVPHPEIELEATHYAELGVSPAAPELWAGEVARDERPGTMGGSIGEAEGDSPTVAMSPASFADAGHGVASPFSAKVGLEMSATHDWRSMEDPFHLAGMEEEGWDVEEGFEEGNAAKGGNLP